MRTQPNTWTVRASDIDRCPRHSLLPTHYHRDGTCRCGDTRKERTQPMDPNATLRELRAAQADLEALVPPDDGGSVPTTKEWEQHYDAQEHAQSRAAEAGFALDEWLSKGGHLPDAWRRGSVDTSEYRERHGVEPAGHGRWMFSNAETGGHMELRGEYAEVARQLPAGSWAVLW